MDLEPYADNPIIDELIWLEQSGRVVDELVAVVAASSSAGVLYTGASFEHFFATQPGCFATWWSDATAVLADHPTIKPLQPLDGGVTALLAPAESRMNELRESDLRDAERKRLSDAVTQAEDAFRQHQYDRVVSLLDEFEPSLAGSILRKLHYARRKVSEGAV